MHGSDKRDQFSLFVFWMDGQFCISFNDIYVRHDLQLLIRYTLETPGMI